MGQVAFLYQGEVTGFLGRVMRDAGSFGYDMKTLFPEGAFNGKLNEACEFR